MTVETAASTAGGQYRDTTDRTDICITFHSCLRQTNLPAYAIGTTQEMLAEAVKHHWVVPLVAVMARRLDTHRELPEQVRGREQDSGYDLGP